jgi:hypothetical protein
LYNGRAFEALDDFSGLFRINKFASLENLVKFVVRIDAGEPVSGSNTRHPEIAEPSALIWKAEVFLANPSCE